MGIWRTLRLITSVILTLSVGASIPKTFNFVKLLNPKKQLDLKNISDFSSTIYIIFMIVSYQKPMNLEA